MRISIFFQDEGRLAIADSTAKRSHTSSFNKWIFSDGISNELANCCNRSHRRAAKISFAPALAKILAQAAPIPLLAPVIKTIWFCIEKSSRGAGPAPKS